MTKEITIDKFRYWLIVPFLFEKTLNIDEYWRNCSEIALCRYIGENCYGFTKVAALTNNSESEGFEEIFVAPEKFIDNKNLIIAFGKLNENLVSKYINISSRYDLWKLQHNLFFDIQSSKIFGAEIENILVESPVLLYMEPVEDNLFSGFDASGCASEISHIIKILGAHENNWSVIILECFLAGFKYWDAPWDGLIFINTEKIVKSKKSNINLSYLFIDMLKQVTSYNLLNHRKNQLNKSALSKFELQSPISTKSFAETSELHLKLLSALGQFSDYRILLMDELPKLKELNNHFLKTLADFRNHERTVEPTDDCWKSSTIFEKLENDVSASIYQIEQDLNILSSKAEILSSFSQDRLNTEISIVNMNLQKKITFLTAIMALLTIVLALESDLVKEIISLIWSYLKL